MKTAGIDHINNVNAYDSRLIGWMFRFQGVATKYLPNYLGWHRMLDKVNQEPTLSVKTNRPLTRPVQ